MYSDSNPGNRIPNMLTLLVALPVWLGTLAAAGWINIMSAASAADVILPMMLTAAAVAAATIFVRSYSFLQSAATASELDAMAVRLGCLRPRTTATSRAASRAA